MDERRARVIGAWVLLVGSLIGWPASQLTIASDEPPFTLGLSWLAITMTAADFLTSSQVHAEAEQEPAAAGVRRGRRPTLRPSRRLREARRRV